MSARNHSHRHLPDEPRLLHHRGRVSSLELHLLEERIAAQSRDIQTLLHDNQRLAVTHVKLKQELINAEQDVRHLSATAASVKAERDAQVREVYNRSLRLEEEARSIDGIPAELDRVRSDIQELRSERKELSENLRDVDEDLARTHSELMELPALRTEIEALYKEIQRGRTAIEYERTMRARNYQLSEAMEKHMIYVTHEAEKLCSEIANAERRAMASAAAAMAAATAGPAYATQHGNLEAGYGENSRSDPNAVHQAVNATSVGSFGNWKEQSSKQQMVNIRREPRIWGDVVDSEQESSVAANPLYVRGAESHASPPEQYGFQGQHVHGL